MPIKLIPVVVMLFLFSSTIKAQIAVVTPSGNTSICPTIDSAMNKANASDIIYLPAGNFGGFTVTKKVTIIGVGHHPDSSAATGRTIINGDLTFSNSSKNSLIDGLVINAGSIYLNSDSCTILRCNVNGSLIMLSITPLGTKIRYSVLDQIFINSGGLKYSEIKNNVINGMQFITSSDFSNNTISNNIFLGGTCGWNDNNLITNNIFINWSPYNFTSNICNNNIFNSTQMPVPIDSSSGHNNIYGQTSASTFVNQSGTNFNYSQNYHLKPISPGVGAGTDGTDIGIYGSAQPWKDGNIPPNPHIYFKNVAQQTGADGKLLIQYKVRANN
jgi:hypothetical protein